MMRIFARQGIQYTVGNIRRSSKVGMLEVNTNRALLTDLYELTMAAGFFEHHIECTATFELFVRQLPP